MRHTMMTFSLHRKGVVLLALGAILLGALLYMAGCLVGQRRGAVAQVGRPGVPRLPSAAAAKPTAVRPKVPAAPAAPVPVAPQEAFALRAGTFTDEAEAQAFVQELAGRGLPASLAAVPTSGGARIHAVLVGRYPTREAAAAAASELVRREGLAVAVVPAKKAP
jgi:cell division septation protein DedD